MSGLTTFEVVEPKFAHELLARLHNAAMQGVLATFSAVSLDDPREEPEHHLFTVKVSGMSFIIPMCDAIDQDKNVLTIKFPQDSRPNFTIFYP